MKKIFFVTALGVLASASFAQTLTAMADSVVETTGTYSANSTYMNFGLSGGRYNSFAVLDFDGSVDAGDTVTSATLTLTHSDYSSSKQTSVTIFAVSDNTANVGASQTSIVYGTGAGFTNGLGSQLGTVTELGTYTFVPNMTNVNTHDVITLSNLSALTSQLGSASADIRLVLTSDQAGLSTNFGIKGGTPPSLTLGTAAAVPEPSSFAVLGVLGLGLLGTRKRK